MLYLSTTDGWWAFFFFFKKRAFLLPHLSHPRGCFLSCLIILQEMSHWMYNSVQAFRTKQTSKPSPRVTAVGDTFWNRRHHPCCQSLTGLLGEELKLSSPVVCVYTSVAIQTQQCGPELLDVWNVWNTLSQQLKLICEGKTPKNSKTKSVESRWCGGGGWKCRSANPTLCDWRAPTKKKKGTATNAAN